MVKEGYWFGLPPLVAGGVLLALGISAGAEGGVKQPLQFLIPGGALVFLALFVFYFFRNPERNSESDCRSASGETFAEREDSD